MDWRTPKPEVYYPVPGVQ